MIKLFNQDCLEKLKAAPENSIDALITDPPAGISFMGKEWDSNKGVSKEWIAWMSEIMSECLRVMKPGAHGLVWAIPRTSHWTATACEQAGFEIRDVVTHLFGSGFPKSLDISKAIDKSAGKEREVVGTRLKNTATHYYENGAKMGNANYGVAQGDVKIEYKTIDLPITAPATDSAKQWSGWGTALKPASEHWILIRKPISEKTVAANVLKWGVGGINIDGCRVSLNGQAKTAGGCKGSKDSLFNLTENPQANNNQGRFPANLVFSHTIFCTDDECEPECAVKMLDEQSGILKSGELKPYKRIDDDYYSGAWPNSEYVSKSNSGGASRFFYCAKASKKDRGEGNTHPTVKASKLMEYLIKLVTPPNGIVLDPFMGSGSTGVAAKKLGFKFIGIEKEKEYFEIAQLRIGA